MNRFDLQLFADTATDKNENIFDELKSTISELSKAGYAGRKFFLKIIEYLKSSKGIYEKVGTPIEILNDMGKELCAAKKDGLSLMGRAGIIKTQTENLTKSLTNLNAIEEPLPFSLAITMCVFLYKSVMSSLDNELTEEEKTDLDRAFANVAKESVLLIAKIINNETSATMPFSLQTLVVSCLDGLVTGLFNYFEVAEKYSDDGLPENIIMRESVLDAVAQGLHETAHMYVLHADDVAFEALKFLAKFGDTLISWEKFEYSPSEKHYMEWIVEYIKRELNDSSSFADIIEMDSENSSLYAQDGNDRIYNVFPNNTIYGGHGNDSISLYKGAKYNSVFGGNGNDYIYSADTNGTIYAGKDNDTIITNSSNGKIFGEDGSDVVHLSENSDANTLSGGKGNNVIILSGAKNIVVEYTQGDGMDIIVGWDSSDVLKIKGEYSTVTSGDDVIINVGSGGIILNNAKDLRVNINTIELDDGETLPAGTSSEIVQLGGGVIYMPNYQGRKVIRGTSADDNIENTYKDVAIYGAGGNDTINNNYDNVTLSGGAGNDSIRNRGLHVTVDAGAGNDFINNDCSTNDVYINAGSGDDTVNNTGFNKVRIDLGEGNDSVYNWRFGENVTVDGGAGSDTVYNRSANSKLLGGADNDSILNDGANVTIDGGAGKDTVNNYTGEVTIAGGEDNDNLVNFSANVTMDGGAGNDYLYAHNAEKISIDGGAGNDTFISFGRKTTLRGGDGNDVIGNYSRGYSSGKLSFSDGGSNVTIDGGAGNDSIYSDGVNTSINGGAGDDTIRLGSNAKNILIQYTEGFDLVAGFNDTATLDLGGAEYFTQISGEDIVVKGGDDSIILQGAASLANVNISGKEVIEMAVNLTEGNDQYTNNLDGVTINALGGNDSIRNEGTNVSIDGGLGDDSIDNRGENSTIAGGEGSDTIWNSGLGENSSVDGGNGNDQIGNSVNNVTITAGAGNDSITNVGWDTSIFGGADSDTIHNEGSNVFIDTGAGDDSIKNGGYNIQERPVTINAGDGNDTVGNQNSYSSIVGGNGNDYIGNSGWNSTIDGGAGNDTISNGGHYSTLRGGYGNDSIINSGEHVLFNYSDGDGNDVINGFNLTSTLQIGDGNATFATRKRNSDIIVKVGNGNITLKGAATLSTLNISGKEVNDTAVNLTEGIDNYTNYTSDAIIDAKGGDDRVSNSAPYASINGGAGDDYIINNGTTYSFNSSGHYSTLTGGAGNDKISNNAHYVVFDYNSGDGNDTISGLNSNSTLRIGGGTGTYSTQVSGSDVIVKVGTGSIRLPNMLGSRLNIEGVSKNKLLVEGTDADDTLRNDSDNATVHARGGNNLIYNFGSSATLTAGDGEDMIYNYGSNVSIDAGDGRDNINNYGNNVTITGGASSDYIWNNSNNGGASMLINYTGGDDYIGGFNTTSTLQIADGNGTYATIAETDSYVVVKIGNNKVTLNGSANIADNLHINGILNQGITTSNTKNNTRITGTSLIDSITNSGNNVTIDAQGEDDIIRNSGSNVKIIAGAGENSVWNTGSNVSVTSGDGKDWFKNEGDNSTIDAGDGDDWINNDGSFTEVRGGGGSDYIDNWNNSTNSLIDAGDDNDQINSYGSYNTLLGGNGNDYINSSGMSVLIDGGAGNDRLYNYAMSTTIDGGLGNDTIRNYGDNVSINAGDGDDYIETNYSSKNVTIDGGAGDDIIVNGGQSVLFKYSGGYDLIRGFKNSSTLSITGSYTAQWNDRDLVLKVGDDYLTLANVAGLSTLNIFGKGIIPTFTATADDEGISIPSGFNLVALTEDGDYHDNHDSKVAIIAQGGNDYIDNNGANVLINAGKGDDYINNYGANVTINGGASNDTVYNYGLNASINAGSGDDTIDNYGGSFATIIGGKGHDEIHNNASNVLFLYNAGDGFDQINGFNETSTLRIGNGTGTYFAQASASNIVLTIGTSKLTLAGAASLAVLNIEGKNAAGYWTLKNTTATYTEGDKVATVSGLKSGLKVVDGEIDGLVVNGNVIKLSAKVLGTSKVTVSGDYNLALAEDVPAVEVSDTSWSLNNSTATLKGNTSAGYSLDNNAVTYSAAVANKTLATVAGVKSLDGIALDGKTITISAQALGKDKVTVTGDYTLALADDVAQVELSDPKWTFNNNVAIFKVRATAGYTCDGKSIDYSNATTKTLAAITGINSAYDLTVDEATKTITLPRYALGSYDIKITGDYKLALADDVAQDLTSTDFWNLSGTTANYCHTTYEYYTLAADGKSVTYTRPTSTVVASISGLKSIDGITVDEATKTITLPKSAILLAQPKVTGDYTLNIDYGNAGNPTFVTGTDDADNLTNYNRGGIVDAKGGNDSINNRSWYASINAGAGDDTINNSYFYNLFDYNSGDGNDLIKGFNETSTLQIGGGSGTYTAQISGNNVIVTVGNGKITLENASDVYPLNIAGVAMNQPQLLNGTDSNDTLRNIHDNSTINALGGVDTVYNGGDNLSIDAGTGDDYIRNFGDNVSIDGGDGHNNIDNDGNNVTINGGASSDYIWNNSGKNVLFKYTGGDDYISGFNETSTLQIGDGTGTYSIIQDDWNVVIKVGDNEITLSGAGELRDKLNIKGIYNGGVKVLNVEDNKLISGTDKFDRIENHGSNVTIDALDDDDRIDNYGDNVLISAGGGSNHIENHGSFNLLLGGDGNDYIHNDNWNGGGSHVTINGGAGNDNIDDWGDSLSIDGGAGNDWISSGSYTTVNGGDGDDTIDNGQRYNYKGELNGGAGDDYISNAGTSITIDGGTGDDYINNSGQSVLFKYSGGYDLIRGFNNTSTLSIAGNFTAEWDDRDLIVKVGDDYLTLANVAGLSTINILGNGTIPTFTATDDGGIVIPDGLRIVTPSNNYHSNSDNNVAILTQDGNDYIENNGDNVYINTGKGDDYISNWSRNVTINGGASNDNIINWNGRNVSINGGSGDDTIENYGGSFATIIGGKGHDEIRNNASNVLFLYNEGDGFDRINGFNETSTLRIGNGFGTYFAKASASNIVLTIGRQKLTLMGAASLATLNIDGVLVNENTRLVDGTDGNDSINNTLGGAVIRALGGNDKITNSGDKVTIGGGEGNDTIDNRGSNVIVNGGAGNDSVVNSGANVTFVYNAGDGSDTIDGFNETSTLKLGSGKETYFTQRDGEDLIVTFGNDKLTLKGAANLPTVNIAGVYQSKHITNQSSNALISGTEGDDYISNDEANVTINTFGGDDQIHNYGDNVSINGGGGSNWINNYGSYNTVLGGDGNDYIYNGGGSHVTINGGAGNDRIDDWGDSLSIDGGEGNDWISSGSYTTVNGGDGNDTINNEYRYNYNSELNGGNGDDYISATGVSNTIDGGAGNDIIKNSGQSTLFKYSGGYDLIRGFNNTSTLSIDGNYTAQWNDRDLVLKVGDDYLTLSNVAGLSTLNIIGKGTVPTAPVTPDESEGTVIPSGFKLVALTDGGDYHDNHDSKVAIIAQGGNDNIDNNGDNVYINAGDGSDYVYNARGANVSIVGGLGEDNLHNAGGTNSSISGGAGNDYIHNYTDSQWDSQLNQNTSFTPDYSTLDGGTGNDQIYNTGGLNVSINAGSGDDTIYNNGGSFATIIGGKGYDEIHNHGDNVLFLYNEGDGFDRINGFNETSTLRIGDGTGTYFAQASASNIVLTIGTSKLTLAGAASLAVLNIEGKETSSINPLLIVGTDKADKINNDLDGATINALEGNNYIWNTGSNVSITGGTGNDTVFNQATSVWNDEIGYETITPDNSTIVTGNGNDYVHNDGSNVMIDAGAGNDEIQTDHYSHDVSISGGKGDDTIITWSSDSTINGGAGDDSIENVESKNLLIQYNEGDGNDTIDGFNETSTLQIGGGSGTYSTQESGWDVIVNVGDGSILLKNAVTLKTVNITGVYKNMLDIVGTEDNDTINNSLDGATINALGGNDTIYNDGFDVSINGGAGDDNLTNSVSYNTIDGGTGNDSITNDDGENVLFKYSAGDGSDTINGFNETSTLEIGGGSSTYSTQRSGDDVIVNVGGGSILLMGAATLKTVNITGIYKDMLDIVGTEDDDYIENYFDGATINALGGNDTIENYGASVIVDGGTGNDSIFNGNSNVTIDGGAGSDTICNDYSFVSINGGAGNDSIYNIDTSLVTIDGGDGSDTIEHYGDTGLVNGGAGNDEIFSYSWNSTINGDAGNDSINVSGNSTTINGGLGDDYISLSITDEDGGESFGYDNLIVYNAGDGSDTVVGFNDSSTLKIDGANYTSVKSGDDIIFNVGKGKITLVDAAGLSSLNVDGTEEVGVWSFASKKATYTVGGNLVLTVNNVKSKDGIRLVGSTVTLPASVLNNANVSLTISNGGDYKLALADDVAQNSTPKDTWALKGTTATYSRNTPAYYKLSTDGKSVTYTKATAAATLATVTGIKSIDDITVDDSNVITLSESNLNNAAVKVTKGNYTLALNPDDNLNAHETADIWTVNKTTATYKNGTPGYYTLAGNGKSITYTAAKQSGNAIMTLTGLKSGIVPRKNGSIDGIEIDDDGTVTVSKDVLGTTNAKLTGEDYTLKFADDVPAPEYNDPVWNRSSTNATFTRTIKDASYTLDDEGKNITYWAKGKAETLASISGLVKVSKASNNQQSLTGIEFVKDDDGNDTNVIKLSKGVLTTTNVKVTGNYTLALDDAITANFADAIWNHSGTSVTLTRKATANSYSLSSDAKTVTYTAKNKSETLASITGLAKISKAVSNQSALNGVELDAESKTITLSPNMLAASNVKVAGNYDYKLALSDAVEQDGTERDFWTLSGTTGSYKHGTPTYYTLAEDGKSVAYAKEVANVSATVKGIKSVDDIDVTENVITLSEANLNNANVSLTGTGYTLNIDENLSDDTKRDIWIVNKTTATFKEGTPVHYTLNDDANAITYHPAAQDQYLKPLATLTGLKNGLIPQKDGSIDGITFGEDNVITLSKDVLTNTAVKVTGDYTLALDDDVDEPEFATPVLTRNGTNLTLTRKATANNYTLSDDYKTVTYTAAGKAETLATVSGLAKIKKAASGATLAGIEVTEDEEDGKVIKLSKSVLGTTAVKVNGNYDYKLELAADVPKLEFNEPAWSVNKTTATFAQTAKANSYELAADRKSISYWKAKQAQTFATVTGLKSGLKAVDGKIASIELDTVNKTITLSANVLNKTAVKVSGDYTLALDDETVSEAEFAEPVWNRSKTTATLTRKATSAGYSLSNDGKTVNYTAANKSETLLTISGLVNVKTSLSGKDKLDGISFDDENKTITLSKSVLGASNVTVNNGYKLELAEDEVPTSDAITDFWTLNGTTATYKHGIPAHYVLSNDGKTVTYVKEASTVLATLTGIKSIDDITVNGNVITLSESNLNNAAVKVTKGNYTLAIDDSLNAHDTANIWTVNKTTATYKSGTPGYYTLAGNGKSITYTAAKQSGNTIMTLTGLKSGIVPRKNGSIDGIEIDDDGTVTVSKDVLGTTNAKLTGEDYTLALDADVAEAEFEDKVWNRSGTTVTYTQKATANNYTLSNDKKTITYTAAGKSETLATISGLAKISKAVSGKESLDDISFDGISFDDETKTITLSKSVLGASNVKVSGNYDDYTLDIAHDVPADFDNDLRWNRNGTNVTLTRKANANSYSLSSDNKTVTYTAKGKYETLATVSGLKSGSKLNNQGKLNGIELDGNTITLSESVLGASNIKVSGNYDDYTLALNSEDDIQQDAVPANKWAIDSKTKTTYHYNEVTPAYYTLNEMDAKSVAYTKTATKTLATVTGLKKNLTVDKNNGLIDGIEVGEDNVITLDKNVLGTTAVKVTGDYTLKLGNAEELDFNDELWNYNKTTVTLVHKATANSYKVSDDSKSIAYWAKGKAETLVTLTGLANRKSALNNQETLAGITLGDDNKITLSQSILATTKAAVSGNYTLDLDYDVQAITISDTAKWTLTNGKASLKGNASEGYTLAPDEKSVTYTAAKTNKVLATINGATSTDEISFDGNKINLSADNLGDNVTVGGSCEFDFAENYSGTILGSDAADTLTVNGSNVSVNGGKGNDVIKSNGSEVSISGGAGDDHLWGNADASTTFLYSNGDGNDVIHNFGEDDLLEISGDFTAAVVGDNLKFTVGKGSITLKDFTAESITVNNETRQIDELTNK